MAPWIDCSLCNVALGVFSSYITSFTNAYRGKLIENEVNEQIEIEVKEIDNQVIREKMNKRTNEQMNERMKCRHTSGKRKRKA